MADDRSGSNDVKANGKYLLLSVPDFAEDPISKRQMTSYLRLGAASTTWEQDAGGDLEKNAYQANLAQGPSGPYGAEVVTDGEEWTPDHVFADDSRIRGGATDGHTLSQGERETQTRALHTRGGWRDHSDGNRISTTYGDKLEVIRGNYKMVVLGRQDDWAKAAGRDMSGSHCHDFNASPGSDVRVEYVQQYDGVWHLQTTTENCVVSENFAGDSFEFRWGKRHESTTGSESPTDKGPHDYPRQNPHIREKTWAESIKSYTGSAAWKIPEIYEETWVKKTESLTNAGSITETVICEQAITSTTTAMNITEATTATGSIVETVSSPAINSTTTGGSVTETTSVGSVTGVTTAGTVTEVTLAGMLSEVLVGGMHNSIELVPLILELLVGAKMSLTMGAAVEIFIGPKKEIEIPEKQEIAPVVNNFFLTQNNITMNYTVLAIQQRLTAVQVNIGI